MLWNRVPALADNGRAVLGSTKSSIGGGNMPFSPNSTSVFGGADA